LAPLSIEVKLDSKQTSLPNGKHSLQRVVYNNQDNTHSKGAGRRIGRDFGREMPTLFNRLLLFLPPIELGYYVLLAGGVEHRWGMGMGWESDSLSFDWPFAAYQKLIANARSWPSFC